MKEVKTGPTKWYALLLLRVDPDHTCGFRIADLIQQTLGTFKGFDSILWVRAETLPKAEAPPLAQHQGCSRVCSSCVSTIGVGWRLVVVHMAGGRTGWNFPASTNVVTHSALPRSLFLIQRNDVVCLPPKFP